MQQSKQIMKKMVEPLKTGQLLVKEGLINPSDIEQALLMQKKRREAVSLTQNRLLGMILCDLNLITPVDNYFVLHKYNKVYPISDALVQEKMMGGSIVSKIRQQSTLHEIPFISALLDSGKISITRMQKLLFYLFHIPLRSVEDFKFDEKNRSRLVRVLPPEKSKTGRIIPLIFKDNTILLGITEPDNMLLIHELNMRYPQYRFKAVFIPYSGYLALFSKVYGEERSFKKMDVTQVAHEKFLDLSLLLKHKTVITDPAFESEAVLTLYHRYEQLRHLAGNPKQEDRSEAFNAFICEHHQKIVNEFKAVQVEYSFRKETYGVTIIAFPLRED